MVQSVAILGPRTTPETGEDSVVLCLSRDETFGSVCAVPVIIHTVSTIVNSCDTVCTVYKFYSETANESTSSEYASQKPFPNFSGRLLPGSQAHIISSRSHFLIMQSLRVTFYRCLVQSVLFLWLGGAVFQVSRPHRCLQGLESYSFVISICFIPFYYVINMFRLQIQDRISCFSCTVCLVCASLTHPFLSSCFHRRPN
jgi:hypothetical protein